MKVLVKVLATVIVAASLAAALGAQGGVTSSISGTVVDANGGVLPGASVEVRGVATGAVLTTVTNAAGVFSVPSVDPAAYTVTVSLAGFKNYVIDDLVVRLGTPASVKAVLTVGGVNEVVQVRSAGNELVNTQTPTVAATLTGDQINKMPVTSRNLVNAVAFLPGVSSSSGVVRDSTFNGLPGSFVAINLDGINDNENLQKESTGFFATISPRQDAVEAVTVTTAGAGADVGGHGAVEVDFVTRSGSNLFSGSAYEYHRDSRLNSNYWFNANAGLPKNQATLNQFGVREGGPIVVPGVYDGHGKAFFFFNYEVSNVPQTPTRTRVVYNPTTENGVYQYTVTSGGVSTARQVNLVSLATAHGINATFDPLVSATLARIQASTATTGLLTQQTDPNLESYTWLSPGTSLDRQAVGRLDYNFNSHNQLSGTFNYQIATRNPDLQNNGDVRFPGATNLSEYVAHRPTFSIALRSTLTPNIVNDLRGGARWSPSYFGVPETSGAPTFADTNGYSLAFGGAQSGATAVTGWTTTNSPSFRNAANWQIDDTLTWQHGKHSITAGGEAYFGSIRLMNSQTVPAITFGLAANDPATALFTTANFPGASNAQLTAAENLFATLTGRVTGVSGQLTLDPGTNQYTYLTPRYIEGKLNEYSTFLQDNWRVKQNLTLSGGLRWNVQLPWSPKNSILSQATFADACGVSGIGADGGCNFFQPGVSGGKTPAFTQLTKGATAYNTDWNNVAPNVGVAWRPDVQGGWLRGLLGDPDQATVRAGYSVQYDREGMDVFTNIFGGNPGSQLSVSKTESNGLLVPGNAAWPVYLSDASRLGLGAPCANGVVDASCNPGSPSFPIAVRPGRADSLSIFDPNIQISSARTFNLGLERSISKTTAVEVRYVGTRGINLWGTQAYNELDLTNNGFLREFQTAVNNLRADVLAGCGQTGQPACTFAYRGPGTGTQPLPIYLAYFDGSKDANNAKAYTGTNWTNATYLGRLAYLNPNLSGAAGDLDGTATLRNNALAAGLPANFFALNPDVSKVTVETSHGSSAYDSLQIDLRHRLTDGFQIDGSYVYGLESDSNFLGHNYGYALDPAASVRHAFKFQWDYELPFGSGRRFGTNLHGLADGLVGGWSFNGVARIQASMLDFGSVRLVNMTAKDLQKEFHVRVGPDAANPGRQIVTMLPADIILNTQRAFNTSATTVSGYSDSLGAPDPNARYIAPAETADCITVKAGDCAPRTLLIRGPFFTRVDVSLSKRIPLQGRTSVDLSLNVFNLFDNINFNAVANPGTSQTIFQVNSAFSDLSNTSDPGGRLGELVLRVNW